MVGDVRRGLTIAASVIRKLGKLSKARIAVHFGQPNVQYDNVWLVFIYRRQRGFARVGGLNVMPGLSQQQNNRVCRIDIVIDHQYSRSLGGLQGCALTKGSLFMNPRLEP
jgi:hypothetical protein